MARSDMRIGEALGFAWSLWRANWRAIWGVLALSAVAYTVHLAGALALNQPLMFAGLAAYVLTTFMSYGAVFRLALADRHVDDPSFKLSAGGVQWRAPEWRMVGASLLLFLFFAFAALLVLLGLTAVLMAVLQAKGTVITTVTTSEQLLKALGPGAAAPLSILLIVVLAAMIYVSVRLSLMLPATFDQKALRIFRTWPLTKGAFGAIFIATLLIQMPVYFLEGIVTRAVAASGGNPAAGEVMAAALTLGLVVGFIAQPLIGGLLAYFYRRLSPPPGRSAP